MTTVMQIDIVREKLKDKNLSDVSRQTGLSRQCLYNILDGIDPRHSSVEKLTAYLRKNK